MQNLYIIVKGKPNWSNITSSLFKICLGPAVIISQKMLIQIFCLQQSSVDLQDSCRHMRDTASHKAFYPFLWKWYLHSHVWCTCICTGIWGFQQIIHVFSRENLSIHIYLSIMISCREFSLGDYFKCSHV